MDNHRINLDGFKEDNVARHTGADRGIGRIHEQSAVFHDEGGAVEFLDIRQRFKQRVGFGDESLHGHDELLGNAWLLKTAVFRMASGR